MFDLVQRKCDSNSISVFMGGFCDTTELYVVCRRMWAHMVGYHLKSCEGVVSEGAGEEDLVLLEEVEDLDVVVEDDGLLLDEGQLVDPEHHLGHVVRVAPHLQCKEQTCRQPAQTRLKNICHSMC